MDSVQSTAPRRVKVYTLEGDKWIDRGTGYCSGEVDNGPYFIVRNENDASETLLKANIEGSTQYQKQQDTLIVWTDNEGNDYALSFQEPEGCLSLCEFLINIQHNVEPNISLVAVISNGQDGEITEVIAGPVPEPCFPTDDNLVDVIELLNQGSKSNKFRETLLDFIENRNYLNKLIEIFERSEKNRNLMNLYYLCDVVKTLVFYNDSAILETFLDDDVIMGLVAILEYDPEFPNYKTNNREYLKETSRFKEVIPINDNEIKTLIKKTFRLQFLKDVVLARLLDDLTFNCISTMIHLNEGQILKFITDDASFLNDLFGLYDMQSEATIKKRREGIQLIHQFVLIAKKFQQTPRSEFYIALFNKGLFKLILFAFKDKLTDSRILATEIIVTIIEHDVLLFNKLETDDEKENEVDMTLVTILIDVLINDSNVGLKTQSFEALKVLLDPVNIESPSSPIGSSPASDLNHNETHDSISIGNEYLQSFYKNAALKLFLPIIKLDELKSDSSKINKNITITYSSLCELLNFMAKEHEKPLSRSFILENHLLVGISELINKSFSNQLRLSALRCLKSIIMLDDEFYTRYIIQNDLLKDFISMLDESNDSNNMVNSTCLNLLNIIVNNDTSINFRLLKNYLIVNYKSILKKNFLGRQWILSISDKEEEEDDDDDDWKRLLKS
ncbi:hypothetical protein CANARDRAFT_169117 [[Candida] arabinofermentans NRRL YB-2248]|uniref:Uncharacterized protein n=1 Tax=[Candida] arabinofermentans NRRL YB-2248 TaxID=983967 RepID=A0A1E4SZM0_9ASCO|nr:hypothetical protein CANARDRAFT_169117 [[Candida] arabinofermentans NRRL YB-2248]